MAQSSVAYAIALALQRVRDDSKYLRNLVRITLKTAREEAQRVPVQRSRIFFHIHSRVIEVAVPHPDA
jgi:hypothetical protein